jgi:crotonobetainyl-CoA:carnitine CoA-transferase CaiB-like acyl-CoA transferase
MNLETPEGLEAVLKLIEISDVLVENNSNGVMEKLGLGHERLLELNPRLIVARMPPMGMTGPMSNYLGYGPNFNSLVGIAAMDGYEGEPPDSAGENYHMDESAPAGLAFAVLAALWDRDVTGRGGLIEFAQAENVMQDIGEFFLDYQMNDRLPAVLGNTDPCLLQDAFRTIEDDRWVVISIRDDRDWQALAGVVGSADWLGLGEQRLLADPHLAARDWFKERTHPAVGTYRYPGHPWRADGFDVAFGRPVPGFGEDNEYVYKQLLGYSDEAYQDLVDRRLVSDEQFA